MKWRGMLWCAFPVCLFNEKKSHGRKEWRMSVKKICMCLVFQVVVPEICIHYQCEYETRKKKRVIYLIVLWKEMCSNGKNGEFAMFFFVDLKIQSVYENGKERWWFCTMERICSNRKKIRESSWKKKQMWQRYTIFMKMRESGGGFVPWKECVSK